MTSTLTAVARFVLYALCQLSESEQHVHTSGSTAKSSFRLQLSVFKIVPALAFLSPVQSLLALRKVFSTAYM